MAINQFTSVSLQYAGQGVIAFDRQKMLAGLPATMQYVDLAPVDINLGGMLPADLDGPAPPPGSPGYYVQVDDDTWGYTPADRLQLWRFTWTGRILPRPRSRDRSPCRWRRSIPILRLLA